MWECLREPHERRSGFQILLRARLGCHACNRFRVRRWPVQRTSGFRPRFETGGSRWCSPLSHLSRVWWAMGTTGRSVSTKNDERQAAPVRFGMQPFPNWIAQLPVCNMPARETTDTLLTNAALAQAHWAQVSAVVQIIGMLLTAAAAIFAWRALLATQLQVTAALEQSAIFIEQHGNEQDGRTQARFQAADAFAAWLYSRLPRDSAAEWVPMPDVTSSARAQRLLATFHTIAGSRDSYMLELEGRELVAPVQSVACTRAWAKTAADIKHIKNLMPASLVEVQEIADAIDGLRVAARTLWRAVEVAQDVEEDGSATTGGALLTDGDRHLAALKRRNPSGTQLGKPSY